MKSWSCLFVLACAFMVQGMKYEYGTYYNPGMSCAEILKYSYRETPLADGIYWIALTSGTMEQRRPFPVFCYMQAGGWTMVFKAIAGQPGHIAGHWKLPYPMFEYSLAALNKENHFKHHYKNRLIQYWDKFTPKEARVVMYSEQGKELMVLRFATENSDNMNWFSESNLGEAPWEDILTATKNHFSLEGLCFLGKCRDFHINNYYKLCSTDRGWLSVGDARVCNWENRFLENAFIFSNRATMVKYNQFAKVSSGEVFAVYLR